MRVQIPAYTDRWMRGDRYGEVTKITYGKHRNAAHANRAALLSSARPWEETQVAHIKLDKSGKTIRVIFADCTEV